MFGDLKVRPKLIVLHNAFFLILACAVYFALIPLLEERIAGARLRETSLLMQIFSDNRPLPNLAGTEIYGFREGSAQDLAIPIDVQQWLDAHPELIWRDDARDDAVYRKATNGYRRARLPHSFYGDLMTRSSRALFVVLGVIYVLAVITLEFLIMPMYVYRPIQMVLRADAATRENDRPGELIAEPDILDDEIGQIMRSRNATVDALRRHEDDLAEALTRLEEKNEMLERAKRNLEQQDRLASIGLLSASVAHEVNTPLAVLHGSIEKLMESNRDAHTRERLERMLRVTQRLRKISESLVDFARDTRHAVAPVDVRAIAGEAWGLLAIDDKAAAVRFHNGVDAAHRVLGDMDRLLQVFLNLLRNSLHAVPPDGEIWVSSKLESNAEVTILVEDNGPGIPPEVLPGIFDAFVTTRLDSKGTGLGLTVSEGIVRQHGGSITASNRNGGGACLAVRLPGAAANA